MSLSFFHDCQFFLIGGPCVIESRDSALRHAEALKTICDDVGMPLIFKSSFDKANRTSHESFRGVGMEKGLAILAEVKKEFSLPILTDVHEVAQVQPAGEVADVLQIPAFLCRQTDLLTACGLTQRWVNIKKGQFLAPQDMAHAAAKVRSTGNKNIMLTERGSSYGYNNLVCDFRSLPIMAETGYPVVFDATHSVQLPSVAGQSSGGERRFIPALARAAVAVGCDGLFMECHLDPPNAQSDAATQWPVSELKSLLESLLRIREKL